MTNPGDEFHDALEETQPLFNSQPELISVKRKLEYSYKENESLNHSMQELKLEISHLKKQLLESQQSKSLAEKERDHAKEYLAKLPLPQALRDAEHALAEKSDECHSLVKLVNHWKSEHAKVMREMGQMQLKSTEQNNELNELTKLNEELNRKLDDSSNVALKQVDELSQSVYFLLEQNEAMKIKLNKCEDLVLPEMQENLKTNLVLNKELDELKAAHQKLDEDLCECKKSERRLMVLKTKLEYKVSEVSLLI